MYQELLAKKKKISVVGLGYVGLPVALAFAKKFSVIGFDINAHRVDLMKKGVDPSEELGPEAVLKIEVKDFPVTVINDIYGDDLYEEGKKKYRK